MGEFGQLSRVGKQGGQVTAHLGFRGLTPHPSHLTTPVILQMRKGLAGNPSFQYPFADFLLCT